MRNSGDSTVAATGSRAGWLHALRWGTFRRVRSAATVQQFGYWFSSIALQWLAAGVLADVRDRRHVLLATQLAVLLISSTMAVLVFLDRAPVRALVADTVPAVDLRGSVLLQTIGMNLARILGPALAGVLIVAWGGGGSLLAYGALGIVSLVVLRRPSRRHAAGPGGRRDGSGRAGGTPPVVRPPGSRWRRSR